ncbi:unnamed protein product [Fraxinus pennsylvanica]|uniref:Uncharacterized protein n=1 Tax=Fraxinus pennsylvanica TaxID=56036 RepID=A0AAD2A7F7_9LAMI|nr:unnamed protein product [Fraxinus pennsylvanica]
MMGSLDEHKEFPHYFAFSVEMRIKPRRMKVVKCGIVRPQPPLSLSPNILSDDGNECSRRDEDECRAQSNSSEERHHLSPPQPINWSQQPPQPPSSLPPTQTSNPTSTIFITKSDIRDLQHTEVMPLLARVALCATSSSSLRLHSSPSSERIFGERDGGGSGLWLY